MSVPPLARDPLEIMWQLTLVWNFGGPQGRAVVLDVTLRTLHGARQVQEGAY